MYPPLSPACLNGVTVVGSGLENVSEEERCVLVATNRDSADLLPNKTGKVREGGAGRVGGEWGGLGLTQAGGCRRKTRMQ